MAGSSGQTSARAARVSARVLGAPVSNQDEDKAFECYGGFAAGSRALPSSGVERESESVPGPECRLDAGTASVDLWVARPLATPSLTDPVFLDATAALLAPDEAGRCARFVFERHRREYLVTRALVRHVLAEHTGVAPADLAFRPGPHGRPELVTPPRGPHFNLSNHPSMVVCAVSAAESVIDLGVDVEPVDRGASIVDIATTVFARAELAALAALPEAHRASRAVTLWTLKEAYIKARGMGLALPLDRFAFDFPTPSGPPRIAFEAPIEDTPARWSFSVRDLEGHRVALAVASRAEPPVVTLRAWPGGAVLAASAVTFGTFGAFGAFGVTSG